MANYPKSGFESAPAEGQYGRHGKRGHINWLISVHPDVKTEFVFLAENRGVTLKSLVVQALEEFLNRERG